MYISVSLCEILCVFVQKYVLVSVCVCVCLRLFVGLHENENVFVQRCVYFFVKICL